MSGGGKLTTVGKAKVAQAELGFVEVGLEGGSSAGSYQSGDSHKHKTRHDASEEGGVTSGRRRRR